MRYYIAGLAVCVGLAACNGEAGDKANKEAADTLKEATTTENTDSFSLDNEDKKASYAIGLRYGEGFGKDLQELDLESFFVGLRHGFEGTDPLLNKEELIATLQALQARKLKEQQDMKDKALEENKAKGEAFLAENKAKEGVKVTDSGLQYTVITEGEGATPGPTDQVKVHYHGTLPDGSVFDSSIDRGEPITFGVNGVIKGWTEALQMMQEGDKWQIVVPSDLAYGERGAGPKIGPNQVLIFDVELLEVIKPEAEE